MWFYWIVVTMMVFLAAPWNVLLVWDSVTILNLTFHLERCTSLQNETQIKQCFVGV